MELLKAEITGFGKWRQTNFDFVKGNQLFFGLNEEGKSTLYQFIIVMLFGFPNKSRRRRNYEPLDGSSFGGRLWLKHPVYGELLIERFRGKNRGKATVFKGDNRYDEKYLAKVLSPLTEESFRKVFTLNQEQLTDLSQVTESELHASLTSLGAVGSNEMFQMRQRFDNQAQNIYKRRGLRQPLNEKLRQLQQLQKKIRDKQNQEEEFGLLLEKQTEYQHELAAMQERIVQLNTENAFFAQQDAHWSQYQEWQKLKTLTPRLSDAELSAVNQELETYQQLARRIEELAAAREKAQDLSNLGKDFYFYLENEERIQQILENETQLQLALERLQQAENPQDREFLANYHANWGWDIDFPPQPLTQEEQHAFNDNYRQLQAENQQLALRLQLAEEQRDQLDAEIEKIEAQGNYTKQNVATSRNYLPVGLFSLGILGMVASGFFLSGSSRIFGVIIAGLLLAAGGYLIFNGKKVVAGKNSFNSDRQLWQEKLVQLDQIQAVIYDYEKKLMNNQHIQQQLEQDFKEIVRSHHLGQITLENLSEGLQELSYYLRVLQEYLADQQTIEQAQNVLAAFENEIQFLTPWLPLQGETIATAFKKIKEFNRNMSEAKQAQSQQQIMFIQQDFLQQTKLQRESLQQLAPLMARFQLEQPSDLLHFIEEENNLRRNQQRFKELTPVIEEYFPVELTKEEFQYAKKMVQKKLQQENNDYQEMLKAAQKIAAQINQLEQDGTLDELYSQQALLKSEVNQLALEWSKYRIAENVLGDLSTELSNIQLPALLEKASQFIEILTEGQYQSIEFAEDLMLRQKNQLLSIFELSTGTKDQVMMALRFGFLALEKNRQLAPIMIDDGWLHYDYRRKKQLAQLLMEFGKHQQIICFSSDREMLSYYHELRQPVKNLGGDILEEIERTRS